MCPCAVRNGVRRVSSALEGLEEQIGCATGATTTKLDPRRNKLSETSQPSRVLLQPGCQSTDVQDWALGERPWVSRRNCLCYSPAEPNSFPDRQRDPDKPTEARRQNSQASSESFQAQTRASRNPIYPFDKTGRSPFLDWCAWGIMMKPSDPQGHMGLSSCSSAAIVS
ncbi:hypothetical protein J7T55_002333 [Diaporthe amygdali]|uniref:uncharacterized protein n=1 Tax=Phomopsis amygdali TaxID=1214568 RepID=UPI0022FE0CB4|nr:uncharacterized protein J7T55_002333 [Diaporthe amygdali]KAJ0109141.1 hypothetical protein J7T55_002333 [Diaporthe amygdali]